MMFSLKDCSDRKKSDRKKPEQLAFSLSASHKKPLATPLISGRPAERLGDAKRGGEQYGRGSAASHKAKMRCIATWRFRNRVQGSTNEVVESGNDQIAK
jgi:hypothetical protein